MNKEVIKTEIQYKAVRSSGAGGQNVNKVATKVQLVFIPNESYGLTEDEKATLNDKLANRLSKGGSLRVECDDTRSQLKNKKLCVQRLFLLLENALKKDKKRIATKIPKSVIKKRLDDKRRQAEKKENRNYRY